MDVNAPAQPSGAATSTIDPAALAAGLHLPARQLSCSGSLCWRTVLARVYEDPDETEGFTTAPTRDLLIVINLTGTFTMQARRGKGWSSAPYRPGSIGLTAPGNTSTLRWHHAESERRTSLHLHLSRDLLSTTAEGLGRPSLAAELPDTLLLGDPVVLALGHALGAALAQRAEGLHADALAQALALHLISGPLAADRPAPRGPSGPRALDRVSFDRVVAFMEDHIAGTVVLDDLAREASVSKYHFLRRFTAVAGETPHRHLVRLRMRRAGELLRTGEETATQIARRCGYASPSQFSATFRKHYGVTPTQYRQTAR